MTIAGILWIDPAQPSSGWLLGEWRTAGGRWFCSWLATGPSEEQKPAGSVFMAGNGQWWWTAWLPDGTESPSDAPTDLRVDDEDKAMAATDAWLKGMCSDDDSK